MYILHYVMIDGNYSKNYKQLLDPASEASGVLPNLY